jgi:hypothetical protein
MEELLNLVVISARTNTARKGVTSDADVKHEWFDGFAMYG